MIDDAQSLFAIRRRDYQLSTLQAPVSPDARHAVSCHLVLTILTTTIFPKMRLMSLVIVMIQD